MINVTSLNADIRSFMLKIGNKTLEDLGGQEGLNTILLEEIANCYEWLRTIAIDVNEFETAYNSDKSSTNSNIDTLKKSLENAQKDIVAQTDNLGKSLNTSIARLSVQMITQSKAVDKAILRLSDNINALGEKEKK